MNHEKFKGMEHTLAFCSIKELVIPVEQDYWLIVHPEEQNKAMRVYRDAKGELTFVWTYAFSYDEGLESPSCFCYEQAIFATYYFGIGDPMKVTLTCKAVRWGAGLFNTPPKGLEGLSYQRVVLKEDYLKDGTNAETIAKAWFLGPQVYSDLERLSPKANKIKVGDLLSVEYYRLAIPQPIQEFLQTGQLFVLVVDGECWYAESKIDFVLDAYDKINHRTQNKITGWKYRDYKAIACISRYGVDYPHSTREVDLKDLLREAKDETQQPFREVRDAMTFTNLQRTLKEGGLMSLEVKDSIPVLLNSFGQKVQDYNRYSNPGIHQYLYQIGLDVAYYTENPDQLIADAR